jgi:succinate dehydrogenase flavin-adding protein (antitoxin of CptAB toxin-antitoxin module)
MSKVEQLEQQIQSLSEEELAQFRAWFQEFDWALWDRQLERDVAAGKLDRLADKASRDHAAGKTKPL